MKQLFIVCLIVLILLSLRVSFFLSDRPEYKDKQRLTLTATLLSQPQHSDGQQKFTLHSKGTRIFVRTARYPFYSYGQTLEITGAISVKRLENGEKLYFFYNPEILVRENRQNALLQSLSTIRQRVTEHFNRTLDPVSASLLLGIVFGIQQGIPKDFSTSLQSVGVMHVVAASGMNVSMVAGMIFLVFSRFFHRKLSLILSSVGIICYAILAGLEPSIVRASIMALIAFSASLLGRQYIGLFSLILTGCIMVFVSPGSLFDVGFQLSFLATAGIILIPPLFGKLSYRPLAGDFLTTIAAQIATVPILLGTFGNYSLLSILVNTLVLWSVPILMTIGVLAALLAFAVPFFASLLLYLSIPFLWYFIWIVQVFGKVGWSVNISELPVSVVIGYYFVLVGMVIFFSRRSDRNKLKVQSEKFKITV